ncbi:MAG: sigma-54-dependent transcriptional regulator [Nitrospinota bacterium]
MTPDSDKGSPRLKSIKALLVDDDDHILHTLGMRLRAQGAEVRTAGDGVQAVETAAAFRPDVVLLDLKMPRMDGLSALREIRKLDLRCQVIVLTAHGTTATAVEAMREGAVDFLEKPLDPDQLSLLFQKVGARRSPGPGGGDGEGAALLPAEASRREAESQFIGEARAVRRVRELLLRAAPTQAPILVAGESGVGKEVIARTIHALSPRRDGPFIVINCAAIPENLFESEVFGHERGAFTGAAARRAGAFELAHGGTLFLDEVAEMPPDLQVKFLRVLEAGRFRLVGGREEIEVDVRIVAATNRDLPQSIEEGRLRKDLFYRLNVFTLFLPPLRERREDFARLAHHFLNLFNARYGKSVRGFSGESWVRMENYSWPGNVRELRNVVERAVILCPEEEVQLGHLPEALLGVSDRGEEGVPPEKMVAVPLGPLSKVEERLIAKALDETEGKKPEAARLLGISLKTFYNKLKKMKNPSQDG